MSNKITKHYVKFHGYLKNGQNFTYIRYTENEEESEELGFQFTLFYNALIEQGYLNANIYDAHIKYGTVEVDEDEIPF